MARARAAVLQVDKWRAESEQLAVERDQLHARMVEAERQLDSSSDHVMLLEAEAAVLRLQVQDAREQAAAASQLRAELMAAQRERRELEGAKAELQSQLERFTTEGESKAAASLEVSVGNPGGLPTPSPGDRGERAAASPAETLHSLSASVPTVERLVDSKWCFGIHVVTKHVGFTVIKRYSDFAALHAKLRAAYGAVTPVGLPPKRSYAAQSLKFAERRRQVRHASSVVESYSPPA